MVNSNDRFVQSCCKCLCRIHSDTQTAWHTGASCESNAIDVLYKIDIGFLQSATNRIGLGMGVKMRGLKSDEGDGPCFADGHQWRLLGIFLHTARVDCSA